MEENGGYSAPRIQRHIHAIQIMKLIFMIFVHLEIFFKLFDAVEHKRWFLKNLHQDPPPPNNMIN